MARPGPTKFYGGPLHGDTLLLGSDTPRFQCPEQSLNSKPAYWIDDSLPSPSNIVFHTYHVRRFDELHSSTVYRSLWIAVLEGADLFPEERLELRHDIQNAPWRISRKAHMFDEPREYWAQMVLRFCHRLTDSRGVTMRGRVEVAI